VPLVRADFAPIVAEGKSLLVVIRDDLLNERTSQTPAVLTGKPN
jgi:hypothetical protein